MQNSKQAVNRRNNDGKAEKIVVIRRTAADNKEHYPLVHLTDDGSISPIDYLGAGFAISARRTPHIPRQSYGTYYGLGNKV